MQFDCENMVRPRRSHAAGRAAFVRSVYVWLVGGFFVSAIGALNAQNIAYGMIQIFGHAFVWVLFAAQFGSLIWANAVSRRRPLNRYAYAFFTFICGVVAGIVMGFMQQSGPNVALVAFCMTAAIFLLLSTVAIFSGKDFGFLRSFVIVGVGVMFFGGLLSVVFDIGAFDLLISAVAVIACSAKILWDTSNMLRTENYSDPAGFALSLFVSLYNIFMSLIRLLSGRRD